MIKRLFLVTILVVSILTSCAAQHNRLPEDVLYKEQHEEMNASFEKLQTSETLTIATTRSDNGLTVYAQDENDNLREVGHWEDISWGFIFSTDLKKIAFFRIVINSDDSYEYAYFLADGHKGEIKYLFTVYSPITFNNDLTEAFIPARQNKIKAREFNQATIRGGPLVSETRTNFNYHIVSVEGGEEFRTITWQIFLRRGGGNRVFRSVKPGFDYLLLYSVETRVYAKADYDVDTNTLNVDWDETGLEEGTGIKFEITRQMTGLLVEPISED